MAAERELIPEFETLLEFVKVERGFDVTAYKRPSLMRRFRKRMQKLGIETFEDYHLYLEQHGDEFAELFDAILINVTAFFRDAPAWEFLQAEIVPRIVEARGDRPIRVWSTGCSTGEEAFTAAMVLAETLGDEAFADRVKIYATDVDEAALSEGRHAVYTAKAVEPVPPALREKYFERFDSRYVFRPDLRRAVVFGRHDLVGDAPISRIDLLVSRNTLMYFGVEAQGRILANFHFALNPTGYLFLGKSEVLMTRTNLFVPLDLKRRVFAKARGAAAVAGPPPPLRFEPAVVAHGDERIRVAGFDHAPVAQIVIDTQGSVIAINQAGRALFSLHQRDVGRPLQDLEVSYRPVELRSRVDQALAERHAVTLHDVEWRVAPDDVRVLDLQVSPLVAPSGGVLGAAIAFNDVTRFRRLRDELEQSRRQMETAYEELQSTVEELETTNEELQSTNEELETTNEELQSTNEELETMNEEMQSTNEELETMNDELRLRTDELNESNGLLDAIMASIGLGVVVVDPALKIELWNAQAEDLWGVRREEALGLHLLNLDVGLPLAELRESLRTVLAGGSVAPVELDAVDRRGRAIRCRVTLSPLHARGVDAPRGVILLTDGGVGDD